MNKQAYTYQKNKSLLILPLRRCAFEPLSLCSFIAETTFPRSDLECIYSYKI